MNGHWIKVCAGCGVKIAECPCKDQEKTKEKSACGKCRMAWIIGKPVHKGLNSYMEKVHPNET
jgi:hypothetical protein